jgi:hypothetical protein
MGLRRIGVWLAVIAVLVPAAAGGAQPVPAKKKKPPCGFKLTRNKAHHDMVKIKMTCHRKNVVNVKFTLKKYEITDFKGFPGGFCSIQSTHVAGCVIGPGAPVDKAVYATVSTKPAAPAKDAHYGIANMFISGDSSYGELLNY